MHKALGRGLESLIHNSPAKNQTQPHNGEIVAKIPSNKIKPNRHQPRKHFDEAKLKELAHSIKTHGLTQPIVVTQLRVVMWVWQTAHIKYKIRI